MQPDLGTSVDIVLIMAAILYVAVGSQNTEGERPEWVLAPLPPGIEIVVVYAEGGDYITREQLDWYRKVR